MSERRPSAVTVVATGGMLASMLPLYAVSALAPFLSTDLGLSRAAVGSLVTGTFAVAAGVSLIAGRAVDQIGPRRALLMLGGAVGAGLVAASWAGSYGWLLAALALAGVGQALANPATNVLIARRIPAAGRGGAIGVKQSGVQLAAFAAGLLLPVLAANLGWRVALRWSVVIPVLVLLAVVWLVPADEAAGPGGGWWRWPRPDAWLLRLMGFSLLLGTALSAVNSYLPLYAAQRLGFGTAVAGALLAVFGISGLVGRVWWTRFAGRLPDLSVALVWLSAAAAVCVLIVGAAGPAWVGLVWLGALGVGGTATAANAVSMLAVVRRGGGAGHASAMVSLGFFGGFVVGPAGFGLLADAAGWAWAWPAVAVLFAGAALAGIRTRTIAAVPSVGAA